VLTIEGLARDGRLHPIQDAFAKHAAFQCGYCTPGMIMGAYAFLPKNPAAPRAAVIKAMDQHLYRCGAHVRIVTATETAATAMKGGAR
jgi:aerobic-type carbon monoxide dehydrogenase small subunit (CoxS/CutS family)